MSVPTSDSTDLERLQHKCIGALKELISVAMGSHLVRVTSIPHGPSPQFIDQYLPTVTTKPWAISTTACCTLGVEKTSLDLMDLDFQSLHICSLLNALGQALGAGCSAPLHCSTKGSVICLVAPLTRKEAGGGAAWAPAAFALSPQ